MTEQIPPHEIISAALNRKTAERRAEATADTAHTPESVPNPKQEPAPTEI